MRRGYLKKHLQKSHGISKLRAKAKSKRATKIDVPSYEHFYSDVSDVSEDECFFDELAERESTTCIQESVSQNCSERSIDESQEEIERWNMDLVLELCDSLEDFVGNEEQGTERLQEDENENAFGLSTNELAVTTKLGDIRSERLLCDNDIINGLVDIDSACALILEPSADELDYDDVLDDSAEIGNLTEMKEVNVDMNNNDCGSLSVSISDAISETSDNNSAKNDSDDVPISGENDAETDSNVEDYDEMSEISDDIGQNYKMIADADREDRETEVDSVIVIDSDDEDAYTEYEVSAINLTLQRTTKLVNGNPDSVKRSMSLGYTENVNLTGNVPKKLFDMIQEEFKQFAQYYHDEMK
ncbi:MAG: hypothetical protein N0C90_19800 [Candidatus Thiodiazotropha endolucinida]|nr:hypothetical protein [Candidatus Thiodiazotropha taylori]MCW4263599.1 hypothetical protein [Candidatus Thiodiazotropha endolucinida]